MMRFTFILSIAVGLFAMIVTGYSVVKIKSLRYRIEEMKLKDEVLIPITDKFLNAPDSQNDEEEINATTKKAAFIFIAVFLFFATQFASAKKGIHTKTMKVISVLGVVIAISVTVWSVYIYWHPDKIEFEKYDNAFGAWCLIMFVFSIVGTIHAFRTKT